MRDYLWGEKPEYKEVSYPADWWQAFKERWFPKWAKRRWPVEYEVRRITLHVLYPNFRHPNDDTFLPVKVWDDEVWREES